MKRLTNRIIFLLLLSAVTILRSEGQVCVGSPGSCGNYIVEGQVIIPDPNDGSPMAVDAGLGNGYEAPLFLDEDDNVQNFTTRGWLISETMYSTSYRDQGKYTVAVFTHYITTYWCHKDYTEESLARARALGGGADPCALMAYRGRLVDVDTKRSMFRLRPLPFGSIWISPEGMPLLGVPVAPLGSSADWAKIKGNLWESTIIRLNRLMAQQAVKSSMHK